MSSLAVDVPAIEKQLNELWAQMTSLSSKEGEQAVMRACVLNLVVYAPGEKDAGEIGHIIAQVTRHQPGRVIVVLPGTPQVAGSLKAMVTAQCHATGRGEQQICCEQILITGREDQMDHLPSLVQPLLVPDLPVFLWWGRVPDRENVVFDRMIKASDRVLIDSALLPPGLEPLAILADWIQERVGSASFSDMSWCLLTPWRTLVASFFDRTECLPCLSEIDQVEIEWAGSREVPSQALLIGAWLASRLEWKITSPPEWSSPHVMSWNLEGGPGRVRVHFQPCSGGQEGHEVLRQVRLSAGGGQPKHFQVAVHANGEHLESRSDLGGRALIPRLARLDGRDEAELLAGELEILGHDKVYEQTLNFLSQVAFPERFR